jgi:hypothetical protein
MFDAQLFIDDQLIKSLYNAVALPQFEQGSVTISTKDIKVSKWTAEGQVEASAGESIFAKIFFPISAKASAKGGWGRSKSAEKEQEWTFTPVDAPEGRLTNLAIHYAVNQSNRVWSVEGLDDNWPEELQPGESVPKPLIFLDVDKGYPVMPMAAELANGKVVTFFDKIAAEVAAIGGGAVPPKYPMTDVGDEAKKFWSWLRNERPGGADTSNLLMNILEKVVSDGGRPRSINFRVPLGPLGGQTKSLLLHFNSRETYDTIDFGYHFIYRGKQHGFRVVGIRQSGPALNVLALYEK